MTQTELWQYCTLLADISRKPYDRTFLWISKSSFEKIKPQFSPSRNWFHPGGNYRSRHFWKHIHAIDQGNLVHLHVDTGNVSISPLYAFVHLMYDVIPYCWYALRTRNPIWKLFLPPHKIDEKL